MLKSLLCYSWHTSLSRSCLGSVLKVNAHPLSVFRNNSRLRQQLDLGNSNPVCSQTTNMLRSCLPLLGQSGLLPVALQHASRLLPHAQFAAQATPQHKQQEDSSSSGGTPAHTAQASEAAGPGSGSDSWPKRPPSGYNLFVKAKSPEVKGSAGRNHMTVLGNMWSSLSEEEKRPWNDQSQAIKRTMQAHAPAKAQKPKAPSGWNIYLGEYVKARAGQGRPASELTKEAGPLWKQLPEHDKEAYNTRAKAQHQQQQQE